MEYNNYDLHTLVDLLAEQTSRYTKFISAGIFTGREHDECRMAINKIQTAIFRKQKKENAGERSSNFMNRFLKFT
jgi:hypothetical protein